MLTSPLVTIIIPNYNHERYLRQRIESVLQQSYQDFEILLLDDCSPDNSRAIIGEYAARDTRIQPIFNEQNSGSTFKQWNKGFALARGKYIWIAESDDSADHDFLASLVTLLETDESIVLAYSNSFDMDTEGKVKGTWTKFLTDLDPIWQADLLSDGKLLIRRFMSYCNIVPNASAVVMRTATLRSAGPADESYRVCGDWIFWARLMAQGKVAYIAKPLNYFRSHSNTARGNNFITGLSIEETTQAMVAMQQYGKPAPADAKLAVRNMVNYWYEMWVGYGMPWSRHRAIYRNLSLLVPNLIPYVLRGMVRVFENKASGLRILAGDRFIYRLLKNSDKVKGQL